MDKKLNQYYTEVRQHDHSLYNFCVFASLPLIVQLTILISEQLSKSFSIIKHSVLIRNPLTKHSECAKYYNINHELDISLGGRLHLLKWMLSTLLNLIYLVRFYIVKYVAIVCVTFRSLPPSSAPLLHVRHYMCKHTHALKLQRCMLYQSTHYTYACMHIKLNNGYGSIW